jgi:pyruvate/2-oxoglutarate dehydrogenase complex dihydrolipoamide acyltransferase (E2) component
MASRLKIPKLGMSMTEGTIVEWLVADGSDVAVGDPVYVLETDKTQNEIPSPVAGRIRFVAEEGETYDIGTIVAEIT